MVQTNFSALRTAGVDVGVGPAAGAGSREVNAAVDELGTSVEAKGVDAPITTVSTRSLPVRPAVEHLVGKG